MEEKGKSGKDGKSLGGFKDITFALLFGDRVNKNNGKEESDPNRGQGVRKSKNLWKSTNPEKEPGKKGKGKRQGIGDQTVAGV